MFQVCVIGRIKSGKSSLCNMLNDNNLLPVDQKECTFGTIFIKNDNDKFLVDNGIKYDISEEDEERVRELIKDKMFDNKKNGKYSKILVNWNNKCNNVQFIDTAGIKNNFFNIKVNNMVYGDYKRFDISEYTVEEILEKTKILLENNKNMNEPLNLLISSTDNVKNRINQVYRNDNSITVNNYKNIINFSNVCIYVFDFYDLIKNPNDIFGDIHKVYNINKNIVFVISFFDRIESSLSKLEDIISEIIENVNNYYDSYFKINRYSKLIEFTSSNVYCSTIDKNNQFYTDLKQKITDKISNIVKENDCHHLIKKQTKSLNFLLKIIYRVLNYKSETKLFVPESLKEGYDKFIKEKYNGLGISAYRLVETCNNFGLPFVKKFFNDYGYYDFSNIVHVNNIFKKPDDVVTEFTFNNYDFENLLMSHNYVNFSTFKEFADTIIDKDTDYVYKINCEYDNDININLKKVKTIKIVTKIRNYIPDGNASIFIDDYKFCDYEQVNGKIRNRIFYRLFSGINTQIFNGTIKISNNDNIISEKCVGRFNFYYKDQILSYEGETKI